MDINLSEQQQKELLAQARNSIATGCSKGSPPELEGPYPTPFTQRLATFVTLQKQGNLRGCIGSLEAQRTLIEDVIHNAYASAFHDHRFFPVTESELLDISVEISILSPMTPMNVKSEKELLNTLTPGVDGLLIQNNTYSATFLPQVWEQLPTPKEFLQHLKQKAGLPGNLWPEDMECSGYRCFKLSE